MNKRIHFFVRSLNIKQGGGSHHNAIVFVRSLRAHGHEVDVHTFTQGNNIPPSDIELIEHDFGSLGFRAAQKVLAQELKKQEAEADLFFLYGVDFTWGGGLYRASGGRVPVCVYLDTYLASMKLGEGSGFIYRMKRRAWDAFIGLRYASRVDRFFAVSPFLEEQYVRFGFPKNACRVFPNMFEFTSHDEHTSQTGPVRLLYTGRIIYDKGIDLLLQAVVRLPDSISWSLHIVGDGSLKPACEHVVSELGIGDRVHFAPWLSEAELRNEYRNADIFVHPARWPEPFGRTIVEALSFGLPVVVPSQGGASWIAGDAGIVFTNNDPESLFEAVQKIIIDTDVRRTCEQNALKRAHTFSVAILGDTLEHYITEIQEETFQKGS